jgi:hypothetical protein
MRLCRCLSFFDILEAVYGRRICQEPCRPIGNFGEAPDHYVARCASHDDRGCGLTPSSKITGRRKICLPRAKRRNSFELLEAIRKHANPDEAPDHYVGFLTLLMMTVGKINSAILEAVYGRRICQEPCRPW